MIYTPMLSNMPIEAQVTLIAQIGGIAVALIAAIGGVAIAVLNRARQHAKVAAENSTVVKNEVKNDHTTNLRDESDERHAEILRELGRVIEIQKTHGRQIEGLNTSVGGIRDELRGMREDDRQQREELDEERGRIRALEDTQPHRGAHGRRRPRTT